MKGFAEVSKRPSAFIPFKYQSQYEDAETGLYYNRFRYYDPNAGSYISQDPIGLAGDNTTLYGYVSDSNINIDTLGLTDFISLQVERPSLQQDIGMYRKKHHILMS